MRGGLVNVSEIGVQLGGVLVAVVGGLRQQPVHNLLQANGPVGR